MDAIMKESALKYLNRNPQQYVGILEAIKRNDAEIIRTSESGVLIREQQSHVPMIAADSIEAVDYLTDGFSCYVIIIHNMLYEKHLMKKYGLTHSNVCVQSVYTSKQPLHRNGSIELRVLTENDADFVIKNYHMSSPEHIRHSIRNGLMYGGYNEKSKLIGFIGIHEDGSMGALFVLPYYRGRGYATELESALINVVLEKDRIPYGHILLKNYKSMNLQDKLGLVPCSEYISWLF